MAIKQISRDDWRVYFDRISKQLEGKSAEIDVESLQIGSQIAAEWVPLLGISYDPRDNVLSVAVEGLDHMIYKPQSVYVDAELGQLASMEVIDADQVRHIVKLRDPLLLPGPH